MTVKHAYSFKKERIEVAFDTIQSRIDCEKVNLYNYDNKEKLSVTGQRSLIVDTFDRTAPAPPYSSSSTVPTT